MSEWGNPPEVNAQASVHEFIVCGRQTQGTETSKYLQEKKSTEIPSVVASERGRGQTVLEVRGEKLEVRMRARLRSTA